MPPIPPRIFISYSHDSDSHRASVLALANHLRQDGLNCTIDQYINGFPPEGWQRWMETQIEQADFVLVVCTPLYLKRYRGLDDDGGRGVTFEGVVISQTLYDAYHRNTKFVPVLPDEGDFEDVPLPLKGFSAFRVDQDYEGLYRYLTKQAVVVMPDLGAPVTLGSQQSSVHHTGSAQPQSSLQDSVKQEKQLMSNAMKVILVGGIVALIIMALISGNTTYEPFSPITTGSNNQVTITTDNSPVTEVKK